MENFSEIEPLKYEDTVLDYGALGNFSLSGFEMVLTRYVSTYIITYYLPSGIYNHQNQRDQFDFISKTYISANQNALFK